VPAVAVLSLILVLSIGTLRVARADDADSLTRAARQLAASQTASGLFDFDFDFLKDSGNGSGKSKLQHTAYIVREAAAAFALAKYYRYSHDATVRQALVEVIASFGKSSVTIGRSRALDVLHYTGLLSLPFGRVTMAQVLNRFGLIYQPKGDGLLLALDRDHETAWVGGSAVALTAEGLYADASGDNQFASLRRAWLHGLLAQHLHGMGFRDYPNSIEEASLANGEAWLALATLKPIAGSELASALAEIEQYLIATYSAKPDQGFFSWGMMAAATRFRDTRDRRYLAFVESQARQLLDKIPPQESADENSCSFVEGLAAAAVVIQTGGHRDTALFRDLTERIRTEMALNLPLQIATGQTHANLPGGAVLSSPRFAKYAGAFLAGISKPYIRVDFTAHCISALIELDQIQDPP